MLKTIQNGVRYYPEGRQVCLETAEGKREYVRRRTLVWNQQMGICPICETWVCLDEAVTDHKSPRGMGGARRDDRIENIQAVHGLCNTAKGSQR